MWKTRLSIAIANELRHTFVDGVCFVSLAAVRDPEQVLATIAHEFGLHDNATSSLKQIQQYLGDKSLLLILDNIEQVVQVGPLLQEILAACLHVKMLLTSRAALHIPAEQQFWVSPLELPDLRNLPESKALAQYASIALFEQRACAILPTFRVTATNAAVLAEICTHLDGIPLAIELAAARVKVLPPHVLLPRLSRSLQILTKGIATQPVRQETLRNTIQWSYDLLDSWEQRLFRFCSVFVGGFTLEAIETLEASYVAKYEEEQGMRGLVLDGVDSLIDKSLLQALRHEDEEEEPRLSMLETLREFGRECLLAEGEMEAIRQAHAEYYLAQAEKAAPYLNTPEETPWMRRLERALDNLIAAMEWSLEQGKQAQNMAMALRLGTALGYFWIHLGYFREGNAFFEQALTGSTGVEAKVQAEALSMASIFATYLNDNERAVRLTERSLSLFKELGESDRVAYQLRLLGWKAHLKYDLKQAHTFYDESLTLYTSLGDQQGSNRVRYNMAYLAQNEGNYEQARDLYEEILAYQRKTGQKSAIASSLRQLAQLFYLSQSEPPLNDIQCLLDEGLSLAQEVGDKNIIAGLQAMMGWVAFSRGDLLTARLLIEETIQFCRKTGRKQGLGDCIVLLARISTSEGNYSMARTQFGESIAVAREQGDMETLSACLLGVANLALAQKQYAWAVRLCGSEEKLREENHIFIYPIERVNYDRSIATMRDFLGEKTFTSLWAEGRAMSPDEALSPHAALSPKQATPTIKPIIREKASAYPAGLSSREVEILRLVAQGLSDAEVAALLIISPRTVNTHLTSIYNKLEVSSRTAATRFAVEHHLV